LEYKSSIENYFKENPPSTTKEAKAKIEELTGIKRGLTQTRTFMKKDWFETNKSRYNTK
jgi:hypothetical protein